MKNHFENDELLNDLKVSAKNNSAPLLDERILVSATQKTDTRKSGMGLLPVKQVSWLAGLGAIAAVFGLSVSVSTTSSVLLSSTPDAKSEFRPFQVADTFKLNLAEPESQDSGFSRVWIPEVVAKSGPNLSTADGWGPLYEAVSPTSPEEYAKFLASYFEVEGDLTKETGYSPSDDHSAVEFYQINDAKKRITVTVFPGKNSVGFSVSFLGTSKGRDTPTVQESENKMQTLLQDLVLEKSNPKFSPIQLGDVRVKEKFNFMAAEANLIVDGVEIDLGFSATFNDGGQLGDLHGVLVQFDYKGIVDMVSEVDAISRLGAYWDNPYRVKSIENSELDSSTRHCENNPTMAMKCETTVDEAVKGFSVTHDRDGKIWLVPSYSMYHNGYFIGAVNALSQKYLNVAG